jgi:hypothetical protein
VLDASIERKDKHTCLGAYSIAELIRTRTGFKHQRDIASFGCIRSPAKQTKHASLALLIVSAGDHAPLLPSYLRM